VIRRHGPHYCSMSHYVEDTPSEYLRRCSSAGCRNIVIPGTGRWCSTHVTRRTGVVADRRRRRHTGSGRISLGPQN
jgi:hypothetical protein